MTILPPVPQTQSNPLFFQFPGRNTNKEKDIRKKSSTNLNLNLHIPRRKIIFAAVQFARQDCKQDFLLD